MIYVKVYGRRNAGPEIHRVSDFPATLGRALDNTIIVTDRSVSSHHAIIERTPSGLVLRDLGSTNGLTENGRRTETVRLQQTRSVRVGKIWIEFSNSEEPMEETVRITPGELQRPADWSHPKGWIICGVLALSAILLRYLDYEFLRVSFTPHALLTKSLGFILAAFGLAAALAVFSKVHRRRYQFYPLFAIILGFSILGDLHITLFNLVSFNLDDRIVSRLLDELISSAIIFSGCFFLSRLLFPETPARRRAVFIVVGIATITGATYGLRAINDRDQSPDADTTIALPLRSFPADRHGLDRVFEEIDAVERKIETARKDALEKEAKRRSEAAR